MDELRKPFLIIALILITIAVLVEAGVSVAIKPPALDLNDPAFKVDGVTPEQILSLHNNAKPGIGIPFMALLDGEVLFTAILLVTPLLISNRVQGRIQGIVTLIVAILVLIGGIVMVFVALAKLLLMLALIVAVPFGTIAYMALFGFFDRSGARVALTLLMTLKLCFSGCLVLAAQRFLQNKGLILILLTSLLANLVVSFLHGLVPIPLVSITDAIAAIVVVILALIWAIFFLIGSIISIVKAVV